jgi:hypothetical protein
MTIARRTFAGLLLIVAVALATPRAASAIPKIITVCASGCNFTSINAAANDPGTNAGDSIDVMAGTYTEQVSVPKQLNIFGAVGGALPVITSSTGPTFGIAGSGTGTALAHLDIRGTGSNTTALDAGAAAISATGLALSATGACAVLGGSAPSQLGPGVSASGSGSSCISAGLGGAADSLTGLTVTNQGGSGVQLNGGTLTDSTVDANSALVIAAGNPTVRRTTLNGHGTGGAGVHAGATGLITDSVLTADPGGAAVLGAGAGTALTLRNVSAYASGNSFGLLAQSGATIDARNLIVRAIYGVATQGGTITIGYSNFVTTLGAVTTFGPNQSTDPLLVNPVVGPSQDFHIACAGSPVIGAGVADLANGPTDRDAVSHPTPPSIGAYEFTGSTPCALPPMPAASGSAPTGLRAAALKKCKKKHSARKRRKCRKRAKRLPI